MTCIALAVAGVIAALIGYGMPRDPACFDPPCGGAKDTLIIYGTLGALSFGAAVVLLVLARGIASFVRNHPR